jgi:sensor histidine kinase regulating citrate/malate metabolism
MDFGNINTQIEVADLDTGIDTSGIKIYYFEGSETQQGKTTGGILTVVIPKIIEELDGISRIEIEKR